MIDMENTKWGFKNSRHIGKIEGKLYTLKQLVRKGELYGYDSYILLKTIEEIEKLIKKIEL